MKSSVVCVLLLSVCSGQGQIYGGDGMANLQGNINRMTSDLNQSIMNMNQQIQNDVRRRVNEVTENLQRAATTGNTTGPVINGAVVGQSIVISSSPGVLRTLIPAPGADGQSFYRDSEDKVIGTTLHHTDKIHNPSLGTTIEFRYTLDLTDPNARPVIQPN